MWCNKQKSCCVAPGVSLRLSDAEESWKRPENPEVSKTFWRIELVSGCSVERNEIENDSLPASTLDASSGQGVGKSVAGVSGDIRRMGASPSKVAFGNVVTAGKFRREH
jgi:hypothetical protein